MSCLARIEHPEWQPFTGFTNEIGDKVTSSVPEFFISINPPSGGGRRQTGRTLYSRPQHQWTSTLEKPRPFDPHQASLSF
jgi:hypothetical protein